MDGAKEMLILDNTLLRVLEHFRLAKVDYAKNIMRYTEIRRPIVQSCLLVLEKNGLIEKYTNTSIKRTEAKLKKSAEVHKHHTYFQLTKAGYSMLKDIEPESYLELLGRECLEKILRKKERESGDERCGRLIRMGILDRNLELTKLGQKIQKLVSGKNRKAYM